MFADLTSRDFYLTQGLKFGATFLAYEGDPLTCHSRFLVFANSGSESNTMDVQTLIKFERLANTVAKDLLIAYETTNTNIEYATVSFNKSNFS